MKPTAVDHSATRCSARRLLTNARMEWIAAIRYAAKTARSSDLMGAKCRRLHFSKRYWSGRHRSAEVNFYKIHNPVKLSSRLKRFRLQLASKEGLCFRFCRVAPFQF